MLDAMSPARFPAMLARGKRMLSLLAGVAALLA
jgi:hypothetical protein